MRLNHLQKRALLGLTAAFVVAMLPILAQQAPWVVPVQSFVTGVAGILTITPDAKVQP